MQSPKHQTGAGNRRVGIIYGLVLPMICFFIGNLGVAAGIDVSEKRQFAAMIAIVALIPGILFWLSASYHIVRQPSLTKSGYFVRGAIIPAILLVLESLFIFR